MSEALDRLTALSQEMGLYDEADKPYRGLSVLRVWLVSQGFSVAIDHLRNPRNSCNWYAYKRSKHQARECECNEGKPAQIVVNPYLFESADAPNGAWESGKVGIRGKAGGHWYSLNAYSLTVEELMADLPAIEARLVSAWNALLPENKV